MKIRKYLYDLLDLSTQEVHHHLISKGIGYEVKYLHDLFVVKVRLFGAIDFKLINHIRDQIVNFSKKQKVEYILLDFNQPFDLVGKLIHLKVRGFAKLNVGYIVVLLPDWSQKKKHIQFLKIFGYPSIRFFFSYAGAINWISARKQTN